MDLNKIVNDAMVKIQEEGFVETTVKTQLETTLKKVVSEIFGTYGEFSKQLEKEVKSHLQIDMQHLGLAGYNLMVLNEVRTQLDNAMHVTGVSLIKDNMEKLLIGVKKEYKLSELIEAMKQDENQDHEKDGESISLIIEESTGGFTHIYFDPDEDKATGSWRGKDSKYSYQYQVDVTRDGSVCRSRIADHDLLKNNDIMRNFYGFDRLMFQIFATGAKLIIDEDDIKRDYEQND
ncbi:MAG: hypothetical protein JWM44_4201 [Bacilli bacterium]|nr:hypothetical protein [Bacilli bacterium]